MELKTVPRRNMIPWPELNPRHHFDPAEMQELSDSLEARGVKVPLAVKELTEEERKEAGYEEDGVAYYIYQGERRWRAAEAAGLEELPCVVNSAVTYEEAFEAALLENMQRESLTAMEEARGLERYMEIHPDLNQTQVGEVFGYGQAWVSNRLRLLRLPPSAQDLVDDGIISATAARNSLVPFTNLTDDEVRKLVFEGIVDKLKGSAKRDDLPLPDEIVEKTVGREARIRSLPVGETFYQDFDRQHSKLEVESQRVYITPEIHQQGCNCNGPRFLYESYGYGSKKSRCFNPSWWVEKNQELAAAAEEERVEERDEEEQEHAEAVAAFEWDDPMEPIPLKTRRELGLPVLWEGRREQLNRLFDPSELRKGSVYRAESHGTGDPDDLVTTDLEGYRRAQEKALEKKKAEALRRRRIRGKALAKEADSLTFNVASALPLLTHAGLWGYWPNDVLVRALIMLGVWDEEPQEYPSGRGEEPSTFLYETLLDLPGKKIEQVMKAAAIELLRYAQAEDGPDVHGPFEDDVGKEVQDELMAVYRSHLNALAPGKVLPTKEDLKQEEPDDGPAPGHVVSEQLSELTLPILEITKKSGRAMLQGPDGSAIAYAELEDLEWDEIAGQWTCETFLGIEGMESLLAEGRELGVQVEA